MLNEKKIIDELYKAGARDVFCELFNAAGIKMPVKAHAISDVFDRIPFGYDMSISEKRTLRIVREEVEEVKKNAKKCLGIRNIESILIGCWMYVVHGDINAFYEYLENNLDYERIYGTYRKEGFYLLNIIQVSADRLL